MAKLYFKYGAMGSSKSAQALITKFNYEEKGMKVWLIKPETDTRDGSDIVVSRIGLKASAQSVSPTLDLFDAFEEHHDSDVVIVDECQFLAPEQVDQLHEITNLYDVPVICFGLRTDFRTKLFPGSARLFEIANSITEIKTICECGSKAIVNARIGANGEILTEGEQILVGGNDQYVAMCYKCWKKKIREQGGK